MADLKALLQKVFVSQIHNNYWIHYDDIRFVNEPPIGQGTYATVTKCKWVGKGGNKLVACKTLRIEGANEKQLKEIKSEIDILWYA